jgi:hypothetical protein
LVYPHTHTHRPTKVILYDDMGRGSMDNSFTWNEYGRPSYLTANAVGAEVARGDIDAVYHGELLTRNNTMQ